MKAIIKVIDAKMDDLGIDSEVEETLYFKSSSVDAMFIYDENIITNISGIEYTFAYNEKLFKELKKSLDNK